MEKIRLSLMIKDRTPTEKSKTISDNTKRHQKLDYTTIADQLKTVSWSNGSHPTGVFKPFYEIPTFPLTTKAV